MTDYLDRDDRFPAIPQVGDRWYLVVGSKGYSFTVQAITDEGQVAGVTDDVETRFFQFVDLWAKGRRLRAATR